MKWQKTTRVTLIVGLLTVGLIAAATGGIGGSSAIAGPDSWTQFTSPNPGTGANVLYGVSAASSKMVWAVGGYSNVNSAGRTLAMHWNGSTWIQDPVPNPLAPANDRLTAVSWVPNTTTIPVAWAVGYYETGADIIYDTTIIEYWNGAQWSIVPSPNVSGANINILTGVSAIAANNVWAVGYWTAAKGLTGHPLILHWDGSRWSIDSASNGFTGVALNAVSTISSGAVWAVGNMDSSQTAILYKADPNANWIQQSSPSPGTVSLLQGVAALSKSDVWAVGYYCSCVFCPCFTLTLHWDGRQWTVVSSPNPDGSDELNAVAPVSSTYVWAVGQSATAGMYRTVTMRWDGTQWAAVSSPNPGTTINYLNAVTVVPGTNVCAGGDTWTGGYYRSDSNAPLAAPQTLVEGYTILPQCRH